MLLLGERRFARALTYAHMTHYHDWDGGWPKGYRQTGYDKLVRESCGMTPEDLWIGSSHSEDTLLKNDPVAWVNKQLARFSGDD